MRSTLWIFFILCLLLFTTAKAQQNLVPNWSFESIVSCPNFFKNGGTGDTTIRYATPWQNGNIGTVDLFSSCDTNNVFLYGFYAPRNGVPLNTFGFQLPHSGNNYVGFIVYPKPVIGQTYPPLREYPQVKLLDSLRSNKKYCVSYYVSPADSDCYYSTSRIGCYISNGSVGTDTTHLINVGPQIENPYNNFLNNYNGWTEVQGLYTAVGGENYITIGNFYSDPNTDTLPIHLRSFAERIYYYLDDVSLTEYSNAFSGVDTNLCSGIKLNQHITSTFGAQYNWSVITGDVNSIDSLNIASPTFSPTLTTTYVVQKQQCGITSYDTLIVRVPTLYPASIITNDTTICMGDTIKLSALNNCTWCNHLWNTGTQTIQTNANPLIQTTYQFSQKDSCYSTTDAIIVNAEYCRSPVVIVPNIFTPNGDDINEIWLPQIQNEIALKDYSLTIYSRWGLKVFETQQTAEGWDGHTTAGLPCVEGTYYYVLTYDDVKTGENKKLRGFLQLSL